MKLTDKKIKEGNILIACYLGYKYDKQEDALLMNNIPILSSNSLRYHKDWEMLMLAVIEIAKKFDVSISSAGLWVTTISRKDVFVSEISSMGGMLPIENTWVAIVAFVEWYNKQPKYTKINP